MTDLRDTLLQRFRQGPSSLTEADDFNRLALAVFDHNFASVPAYRAYCEARDRTPETVDHWTDVPAVPTAAFKELELHDGSGVERVFRTSGTTRGQERRGEHHVADLELYRASLRSTFEAFVLADGARPRMVSLMPPASALPDSSLAFMIEDLMEAFGSGPLVVAGADGIDFNALDWAMDAAVSDGEPVLLLGTTAAFIHWVDGLWEKGRRFRLPEGSRVMDTGGYKGMGRKMEPEAMRRAYRDNLGIPAHAVVNEYGMTELLSQYYDDGLLRHARGDDTGETRKQAPGWLRSVAVDPETLDPLPAGETGVLRHVDLANLHSVMAVQTEDVGRVTEEGLVLQGRGPGAPPRGCSIAMDLLLEHAP